MDSLSNWQLVIGVVLAAAVSALNKRSRVVPGWVGVGLALIGTGMAFGADAPMWASPLACLGIGLGLSPLFGLSEDGAAVPSLLLILACGVVCGSVVAGNDFFIRAALFASGVGMGSLVLGYGAVGGGVALTCAVLGAADTLGRTQLINPESPPGLVLAAAVASALLVFIGLSAMLKSWPKAFGLGAALMAALGFFACSKVLYFNDSGLAALVGALVAAAIVWAMPAETEDAGFVPLVGGILMVAVGTAAFSEARGMGMAAAALGALGVALLSDRPRVAAAISPLAILAIYRAFGVMYPEAAKALDIGQHYGIIGVMLGVLLAFLGSARSQTAKFPATMVGWTMGALICGFSPLVIGAKGAVGVLIGLGFAGALGQSSQQTRNSLTVGASYIGASLLGYGLLKDQMNLTRDERLPLLMWGAGIVLILFVAAMFMNRQKSEVSA